MFVFVVASDVAEPFPFSVFAAPTCVPFGDTQPLAVTWLGWHKKKMTVPGGGPTEPDTVTESVTDVPGWTLPPVGSALEKTWEVYAGLRA